MDEPARKNKIRFRNTIDPEFSQLRRPLNWLKPTGILEILHGCTMIATAVTIILSFKSTFLEGQSYSSRITPNMVIGLTSFIAGIRACCLKPEVGFSLDKSGVKCMIGFCGVLTFVSLSMSILLMCLSSYEYHTLVHPIGPSRYSHVEERKSLNQMNIVVSCVSTVVCIGFLVVYVKLATRVPFGKSRASVAPIDPDISVISNNNNNSLHVPEMETYGRRLPSDDYYQLVFARNGIIHSYV